MRTKINLLDQQAKLSRDSEDLETLQRWKKVLLRNPLYRNQEEFDELFSLTYGMIPRMEGTGIFGRSPLASELNWVGMRQFWLWPAAKKVYGVQITSQLEADMFAEWLDEHFNEIADESREITPHPFSHRRSSEDS
jgi:hypothetical protein